MTTPLLFNDLMRDEGLRLTGYLDTEGVPTIGYGHTGAEVFEGQRITLAEAVDFLHADVANARDELNERLAWWRTLDDVRQDVLAEMCFNLGIGNLEEFRRTLAAVRWARWTLAGAGMLHSKWARQVGARASRLAAMMTTGARP